MNRTNDPDGRPLVLLVDDDAEMSRFIVRTLSSRYRLVTAADGAEGLALARAMKPEVILTDIMMPGMDGEAFVDALRGEPELADVPLAIITAQTDEPQRLRLLRQGVQDYLIKPFSLTELSVRLDNLVRRRRAEEDLRTLTAELEKRVSERTCALEVANRELQKEVIERCQAESRLTASLSEKETLLKEVHHRVKNNLQLVYSLLNLQTRHVKDPKTLEGLQDCRHRVMAMAMVHEKLHRSRDLGRINAVDYFRDLVRHLFDAFGASASNVRLSLESDPAPLHVDEAVPCGLILYELVSNSLRHAFPDGRGGAVRVAFRRNTAGRTTLLVEDDGVGLPPDLDHLNARSLGLQLAATLAQQLDATLERDMQRRGTAFKLSFTAAARGAPAAPARQEVRS